MLIRKRAPANQQPNIVSITEKKNKRETQDLWRIYSVYLRLYFVFKARNIVPYLTITKKEVEKMVLISTMANSWK